MTWRGVVWCDVMLCDVMWCDVMWCDVMWCDVIWYDMIWYDMIWYDMIWYDMIWYDMIWYDIWYDMVKDAKVPVDYRLWKLLSVDEECSPDTSVLAQILGHRVFVLNPCSEVVIHGLAMLFDASSWHCPNYSVVHNFVEYRKCFSSHEVSKPSKLAF